ncbi:MAG: PDZ domain-containing protein [Oscillospiraceae bacterium]|jgi:carboxyl-terminal processing protease|nr:PDZ domain-containing protein [Oscillospiraceae bacterium]MDE6956219.1 S-layer homology domain-containing protein [Oscillospiraceae bacterium]
MKKYLSRLLAAALALVLLVVPASALTVDQALELLEELYYYEIPDEAYQAETLDELMSLLEDPYTQYMTAEEYQAFLKLLEGDSNVIGIGVSCRYTPEGILILSTISGGSAREAGLQAGDLIVEIDGQSCVPANEENAGRLTGPEGTQVSVTVLRDGERKGYTLTRRPVVEPNVELSIEGRVGLLDCNSFGKDTGKEFAKLVKDNDGRVDVWVVDLRGNGGGYTNAAVDMLGALMGPGYHLYFETAAGGVEAVPAYDRQATDKPVIVLTDGGSASASELTSGSLRDSGRGVLVGGRTYGKGVAQIMLDEDALASLPEYDGYFEGDGLKITVYRFYSGGLNSPDKIGVIPTLLVDDEDTAAVALALCGSQEDAKLCVMPGAVPYYVDPGTDGDTLSALLSALPPQALVFYADGGDFQQVSAAEAAQRLGVAYESRWFTDLGDSRYADAVNAMGTYGLLRGDGKGHFTPKSGLTRAELCSMLASVLNVAYRGESRFTDVDQNAWYGPSVNAMAYLGIVDGVGGGKFNPGGTLTQEEFHTILGRTARFFNVKLDAYAQWVEQEGRLTLGQSSALSGYSAWARNSMAVLAWGLEDALDGTGDLLFASLKELSPKAPILREEAAAGMYAVLSGLEILP